ncbi:MAG TPA: ribosome-associated translation inhibitor RaiA [Pseudolabrys sp.]|nr:ribosome-associated translation inhibitor RaiA [Pseudolabrys sp.]
MDVDEWNISKLKSLVGNGKVLLHVPYGGGAMPLRVSGRNISIGPVLQRKITERVEEATSKYFRGGFSGHATVGRDGFGFRTECILHLDSGALLEAEGMAPDAYESAEQAADRIEKRLRRYKRLRKNHQARRG